MQSGTQPQTRTLLWHATAYVRNGHRVTTHEYHVPPRIQEAIPALKQAVRSEHPGAHDVQVTSLSVVCRDGREIPLPLDVTPALQQVITL